MPLSANFTESVIDISFKFKPFLYMTSNNERRSTGKNSRKSLQILRIQKRLQLKNMNNQGDMFGADKCVILVCSYFLIRLDVTLKMNEP